MKNHNGESLSGKSVNCKNPFTHSPIHRFAHSPIHSPRRVARGDPFTSNKGFTLIELVITMVLIGIVAYVVATALTTGIKAYFTTDFRKEALDQSRIAMERMTREIRNVRSKGSDVDLDGFIDADIGTANASQFCFINTDGTRISFRYANPNISREEGGGACPGGGGNTLSTNITSLTFSYVYADTAPLTATNIRRAQITLTSTISGESVTLQSEIYLRNLK